MRYTFRVYGEVTVNERDLRRALDAFGDWSRGLGETDEVALSQAGTWGVSAIDIAVDLTSCCRREGRPDRARRSQRAAAPPDDPEGSGEATG